MFYTYILCSPGLDKYYIGSTSCMETRLESHVAGKSKYTSRAKDWTLKRVEAYDTKQLALKREYQIKRWKFRKMIEELISK